MSKVIDNIRAAYQEVQERKLIDPRAPIDGATQIDPDAAVQESKFVIPEEIPANERTAFHGAAAAAAKAGKSHFNFNGKKHPVTMKKDTANAIADEYGSVSVKGTPQRKASPFRSGRPTVKAMPTAEAVDTHASADKKPENYTGKDGKIHTRNVAAKKRKKADEGDIEMNPKLDKGTKDNSMEQKESTIRQKLMAVLEGEDRKKHTPNEDKAEKMTDNRKGKGAEDMMAGADKEVAKGPDAHLNEPEIDKENFKKMTSNVKKSAMRKTDNPKGDTKIVPGGTQFKDPAAMKAESTDVNAGIKAAYASMFESYTHEFDYAEDGKRTAKSFVDKAKKAGIKAKIHSDRGPGGGHPVVHLGHKDTKHMHKFLKKHYDPDMQHDDLSAHEI